MTTDSSIAKGRVDIFNEELKALHAVENWGSSLFLTAIALLSKQLIDWTIPIASSSAPVFSPSWQLFMLPVVLGLVAFLFLRVVNFRIRSVRRQQLDAALVSIDPKRRTFGLVGWFMALMPWALGFASSSYFNLARPDLNRPMWWVSGISLVAFGVAGWIFVRQSREGSSPREA